MTLFWDDYPLARLERFELPTNWFEASYSIRLSYRRLNVVCAAFSKESAAALKMVVILGQVAESICIELYNHPVRFAATPPKEGNWDC